MDATTFSALGEPTRLEIVELLRQRPHSVGDLAAALDVRQPQTSKHLRVLRDAGIVEVEVDGRRRIHHLCPEPFDEIDAWLDAFARTWASRLDALGAHLDTEEPR